MAVNLKYYYLEESSGLEIPIKDNPTRPDLGPTVEFGALFRGNQAKVGIKIFNEGDTPTAFTTASIGEFNMDGEVYPDAYKWKKISLSKTMGFETRISLPDIQPNSWMTGKDIFTEDFSKYPPDLGVQPDIDWKLWGGHKTWEIYSGYLQHNTDNQTGRALWDALPTAKDYEFSTKITVRDGVWAGYIMRDNGDYNTGYIILVQGDEKYFPKGMNKGEGVLQVWSGKFTDGIDKWTLLYQSKSIGIRGTHDYFKVRLKDNRFDFWYKDEKAQSPLYSFIDMDNTYTKQGKPILCTHAGNGSTLIYFDDIRMEVETESGVLWVENNVGLDTESFGKNYTLLNVDYGG